MSDQPGPRVRWMFRPITPGAAHAIVALFLLSFLLSGASYFFSTRAVRGEVASRASVTQLCQAQAKQVILWQHLVAISAPPPHETPAARQKREKLTREFLAYVKKVFVPQDCAANFKG